MDIRARFDALILKFAGLECLIWLTFKIVYEVHFKSAIVKLQKKVHMACKLKKGITFTI